MRHGSASNHALDQKTHSPMSGTSIMSQHRASGDHTYSGAVYIQAARIHVMGL